MSCFICNDLHISVLAHFAARFNCDGEKMTPKNIGLLLHSENVKSYNARYEDDQQFYTYHHKSDIRAYDYVPVVQVLKAAQCLAYQSCEHDGWQSSKAKRILDAIESKAIYQLPGYEDSDWEIKDAA